MRFFFLNFFEFSSFNSLKLANIGKLSYGVLGTAPKFGSAKKLNLSVCLRPPNNVTKGNFLRLCSYKLIVKKSALDVQSLSFFIYLLGSFSSSSPPPSSLPPGFTVGIRTQHSFSKSACHLFTSYVCYSKFGPLMNCFVSLETDIWVERKKQSVVLEKNYCKETTRAE